MKLPHSLERPLLSTKIDRTPPYSCSQRAPACIGLFFRLRAHLPQVVAFGDDRWGQSIAPKETIHSLAAAGVAKILQHQTTGPYYLSGWSLGGFVALEAAVQLQALGACVELVVMFDSLYSFTKGTGEWEGWNDELDPLLALTDNKERWLAQLNRGNKLVSMFSLPLNAFLGRVVLIKAMQELREGEAADAKGGWGERLRQIEVQPFQATHRSMFDKENGKKIGALLNELMAWATRSSRRAYTGNSGGDRQPKSDQNDLGPEEMIRYFFRCNPSAISPCAAAPATSSAVVAHRRPRHSPLTTCMTRAAVKTSITSTAPHIVPDTLALKRSPIHVTFIPQRSTIIAEDQLQHLEGKTTPKQVWDTYVFNPGTWGQVPYTYG
ncbi:Alpha/Beta hydrolase protein [Mycena leptocephala]|nr:Alpha/Beta hydrolase protein [Mycena leptocephala]